MPQSFYYSNPRLGVGVSNLAEAIVGNPLMDVQAGLLGDRRATEQVQRRELEAKALSQEITNRERQYALDRVAELVRASTANLPVAQQPAASASLDPILRYAIGQGDNGSQVADALTKLVGLGWAQDPTEASGRTAMAVAGKTTDEDYARTDAGASKIRQEKADAEMDRTRYTADQSRAGAYERQVLAGEDAMARQVSANDAAMSRTQVTVAGANARHQSPKGSDGKVYPVTPKLATEIAGLVNERLQVMAAENTGDPDVVLKLQGVDLRDATDRAAAIYAATGNVRGAVTQAIASIFGEQPQAAYSDNRWPSDNTATFARAPAAGGRDTAAVLAEARTAIAKGADRNAVAQRLRSMGIDPAGL